MDKLEVLIGWIGMMVWMYKGMKIDMMLMGIEDRVFVDMIEVGMRLMVWICKM